MEQLNESNETIRFQTGIGETVTVQEIIQAPVDNKRHQVLVYDSTKYGQVKYDKLPCGHKFVLGKEPRHRGCQNCWFVYFSTYGELTQTADEVFIKHGEAALVQLRGRAFTSAFVSYMSTLAHYQKILKEANESSTSSIESSNEDDINS